MRVLQLVKTSIGASWALRQMRELVKLGVEVHVAMPLDGNLVDKYRKAGVITHDLSYSLVNIIGVSQKLRKIVTIVKPDIIHSHFVLTTIIMRVALRDIKIPRVFQVPGPLHLESWLFRNVDLILAQKKLDKWIGSCRWTNERYRKSGIDDGRLFLSYYGTDLEFIKYENGILKETLGLKNADFVVGMVAYMYAPKKFLCQKRGLKGHEDFIDALSLLLDKYPNLYGVCIGGAWDNAIEYEDSVIKYGQVKCGDRLFFLGTRSDVPALYGDMDLVVHPSHSENLGGAGESLLLRVPTITSNVGGFPDIVKDGETGLSVPPKEPLLLADAIEKVIKSDVDVELFKNAGYSQTFELLDVKNTAKSIFNIYNKIICDINV